VPKPGATTGAATEISYRTASLTGTVTPNNWLTTYYFEYGPTNSYGSKVPVPEGTVKSETSAENVKEGIAGLEPGKPYHYRLVANNGGVTTYGEDKTFTAAVPAPGASTDGAKTITWDPVVPSGAVPPNESSPTISSFEFGPTTAYGSKVPVP